MQDEDKGVELDLEPDDSDVEENEDGSAIVTLGEPEQAENAEFYINLAEDMANSEMMTISIQLLEYIERDKEARSLRDKQYEEGLRRTGLGDDAPGGADFQGASKVVHPMLTEACVDFSSRVIKELFPSTGPVKQFIPGEITQPKMEKALRKEKFLNWQLTQQMVEFRPELEQMTTQIPLGGAQYMKLVWSEQRNRPMAVFVPIDDVYLPYSATSFYTAERKTHVMYITRLEFEKRVGTGMYREIDLVSPQEPDLTGPAKANNKIEGKEQNSYNEDGLRTVFEVACFLDFEDNFGLAPYLVTIDHTTQEVLSIYRNWDPDDEQQEELVHMVEWPFVPWRGAYPIGLPHMIGSLSAAATGALRALLDSAHINNFPGMLKLKGGSRGGQSDRIEPTQVTEIEGGVGVDDVRKIAMAVPFNPPNAVLFSLLGFVTEAARGVVRTTYEKLQDQNPNVPVGTTLAMIEQGMTVFSAIHGRLHYAMGMTLKVLHRLNSKHIDDEYILRVTGEEMCKAKDFQGPMDVVPVSDPNIFSDVQRAAQAQAVVQRAAAAPNLYDARAVEERFLQSMKIPDFKSLLAKRPEPMELNAVSENLALTLGRPVAAFPMQDHLAHLQVHLDYLKSPIFGMSQLIGPTYIPGVLQHIKEHMVYWYTIHIYEQTSNTVGVPIDSFFEGKDKDVSAEVDRTLAMASQRFMPDIEASLQGVPSIIQAAQQFLQKMKQPPPQDPTQVLMAETQRKAEYDKGKLQLDQQKLQLDQQRVSRETQLDQIKMQERQMDLAAKQAMNDADNRTAKELAVFEAEHGNKSNLSTGHGINP
ncbi:hypothetical protein UFOVP122_29 [uncultured Caudovirales phage]|uniref:Uncharacterized protein n=1 Tax=uncultured Caudovirales phage TaxID=2100421 RepID=A0A6J5LBT0_9CAUD|nr:hypothetical protein UFOVP122_29 [uncultured Caudovirales phage]